MGRLHLAGQRDVDGASISTWQIFTPQLNSFLASIAWPRFLRPPLADSPGRGNCHHGRDEGKATKGGFDEFTTNER